MNYALSCLLIVSYLLPGCSSSTKTTPAKRSAQNEQGQDSGDANNSNVAVEPLDCESQWALALKQQPVGAKFVYDSSLAAIINETFERHVQITGSSPDAISQSITVMSGLIKQYVPNLAQQSIRLDKASFLKACQTQIPQPVAMSTLGGQVVLKGRTKEALVIQGKTIPAECVDVEVQNVTYGGYQVSARVKMYVSSRYPALPLKQILTITDSPNLSIINGASFTDTLKSALPTAN